MRLGDITDITAGQAAPKVFSNDGIAFIRAGHLEHLMNGDNLESLPKINDNIARKLRLKKIPAGSVLFAKSGMSATKNRIYITEKDSYVVSHIAAIIPNEKFISSYLGRFLFWYKPSKLILDSAYPSIRLTDIRNLKIPFPSLETQKQIAQTLDNAAALRDKTQQLLAEYDQLAQSIFLDMFGDKSYKQVELEKLSNKITDGTHHTPKYKNAGIPFLRVTDITKSNNSKKFISSEEHKVLIERCKPEKDDILYSKNGTIGVAKLIDWDFEFSIFVSLCLIKLKKDIVLPKFIEAFLNTDVALNQAKRFSKTGTITNLHLVQIKKIKCPVPPIHLQNQFAEKIALIEQQKDLAKQELQESEDLFQALLQKAFKGELV